jgi:hypothetical protein
MFIITARVGQLTIDGEDTQGPCLKWLNLHELLGGLDLTGEDTPIAGGLYIANRRVFVPTTYTLRGQLCGDVDRNGDDTADNVDGWAANVLDYNSFLGPGSGDGTRALVLSWNSTSYEAAGHVGFLKQGEFLADGTTAVTLDITLPFTAFEAA